MLTGLEMTCVSRLMYYDGADRVWEQAALSKHVCKCSDFGDARNHGCTWYCLPAVVSNMRMTTDDDATNEDWTRDDLCVEIDVL
jgi:hypothetical protein